MRPIAAAALSNPCFVSPTGGSVWVAGRTLLAWRIGALFEGDEPTKFIGRVASDPCTASQATE